MEIDPAYLAIEQSMLQQTLFGVNPPQSVQPEFFPILWEAAEALTSPELPVRQKGLEQIEELHAARQSPLLAYLLSTRLREPDVALRARIVRLTGSILMPDENGQLALDSVRLQITHSLAQMRTYSLMALMQVLESDETLEPYIIRLLGACSVAGEYLADILANRQYPVVLRKQAAYFIGKVGYVDAAPALERVAVRLESRVNGQSIMFDTGAGESDESSLLGTIHEALERLKAP